MSVVRDVLAFVGAAVLLAVLLSLVEALWRALAPQLRVWRARQRSVDPEWCRIRCGEVEICAPCSRRGVDLLTEALRCEPSLGSGQDG